MIDKSKLANSILNTQNTTKNDLPLNVSESFSNAISDGDVSNNFILNSYLDNKDVIK
ncbi:hypothetical protein K5V21_04925 [Clostridium sardiniense]|uniref:Uncharacterized protein n=1 Tax=Clostridium sardiniense TaxID=29369 RepID=A0ABS7KVV0_CLOSR|nr:hypothetical protein [Clostridium sardiniense]MBY0754797.1 hypothetical protein [Clostridium sardiniense]MDQ0461926.1 hypothetical protein [Clostridium sardiniense]